MNFKMTAESKRLFVGNLDPSINESDLKKLFNEYGSVRSVELKKKDNLVEPENPHVFAFIDLFLDENNLNSCLRRFQQKYNGRSLNVSVAKESFLERLKRERIEADQKISTKGSGESDLVKLRSAATRSTDIPLSSDNQFNGHHKQIHELEIDEDVLVSKKNARSSIQNGKIKIQAFTGEALHVIENEKKTPKLRDERAQISDSKRKQSLSKMNVHYNRQKQVIRQALSGIDTSVPKKITFDDDEDISSNKGTSKAQLFSDDENDLNDFENDLEMFDKSVAEGNVTELIRLQAKFKLDPRFKMDERFLEENSNNDPETNSKQFQIDSGKAAHLSVPEIGSTDPSKFKRRIMKNAMPRYDPTKENLNVIHKESEKLTPEDITDVDVDDKKTVEVSKEQFYTVNSNLSKSLKNKTEGFSLLNMFGRTEGSSDKGCLESYFEKPIVTNKAHKKSLVNPFKFDSSDSEVDCEETLPKKTHKSQQVQTIAKSFDLNENFFIFGKDSRLKEGTDFFKTVIRDQEAHNYDAVKKKLKFIINKKITRTKGTKNMFKRKNVRRN